MLVRKNAAEGGKVVRNDTALPTPDRSRCRRVPGTDTAGLSPRRLRVWQCSCEGWRGKGRRARRFTEPMVSHDSSEHLGVDLPGYRLAGGLSPRLGRTSPVYPSP